MLPRTDKNIASALRNRWAKIPGVRYPEPKAKAIPTRTEAPVLNPEEWVSTEEASSLLKVARTTARALLRRRMVRSLYGVGKENRLLLHWDRHAVKALAADRPPVAGCIPEGYVSSATACAMLGVGRATFCRPPIREALEATYVRLYIGRGCRVHALFRSADVEAILENRRNSPKTRRFACKGRSKPKARKRAAKGMQRVCKTGKEETK